MAYLLAAIAMILSVLEAHSSIASFCIIGLLVHQLRRFQVTKRVA